MTTTTETPKTPQAEPHNWTDGGTRVLILRRIDKKTRTSKVTNGYFP